MVYWKDTPQPWFVKADSNVYLIPAIHHSLVSTEITLETINKINPHIVAVEYPIGSEKKLEEAIDLFPLPVIMYNPESMTKIPGLDEPVPLDFYLIHPGDANSIAIWWAVKKRKSILNVDSLPTTKDGPQVSVPDPLIITYTGFLPLIQTIEEMGIEDVRGKMMGKKILSKSRDNKNSKIVWVGGLWHVPAIKKSFDKNNKTKEQMSLTDNEEIDWKLALLHPFSYPRLIIDLPFFVARFWLDKNRFRHDDALVDLLKEAKLEYQKKFDEEISLSTFKKMIQYMRNLAIIDGRIFPSLFNIVEGAKGGVDDDYALEVYRAAVKYPFYPEDLSKLSGLPIVDFGNLLDPKSHLSITLKQRHPRPVLSFNPKNRQIWDLIKAPPSEKYPGEWREVWNKGNGAFSYPPEDLFFEKFMRRVRKKFQNMILEEQVIVEPFTTSIMDGIDWRETTRHIHEGKIFVKKIPKNAPKINTIVLQFTKDDRPYEQVMTWYAEHEQESNLSLVSSNPADLLVGPGIGRAKYAGLISVFPPYWLVAEIPRDFTYSFLDRLIIAAIWSTPKNSKYIGVISLERPSLFARQLAKKYGHVLLYLPISAFPSNIIKKIRVFHVLSMIELREIAKEYIGY